MGGRCKKNCWCRCCCRASVYNFKKGCRKMGWASVRVFRLHWLVGIRWKWWWWWQCRPSHLCWHIFATGPGSLHLLLPCSVWRRGPKSSRKKGGKEDWKHCINSNSSIRRLLSMLMYSVLIPSSFSSPFCAHFRFHFSACNTSSSTTLGPLITHLYRLAESVEWSKV